MFNNWYCTVSSVCLDCVYNILKIRTFRRVERINQIFDKSCYLTSTFNVVIVYRNGEPFDVIETNGYENCLKKC